MSDQKALSSSTVGSNRESAEFSGSTAAATAASAFSSYATPPAETEEDTAVKSFGKNPHPYHTPARPQDEEEERMPLDLFMLEETRVVYNKLITSYPTAIGKSVSRKERKSKGLVAPQLAYSEITYDSLGTILEKIKQYHDGLQNSGGAFYDLGSGTGKAVCAAAILHSSFDKCVGIEVLQGLHEVALDLQEIFNRTVKPTLGEQPPEIQYVLGDILEMEWRDATVVFANCTCYSQSLMASIIQRCSPLHEGTFFITVSKRLKSEAWKVLDSQLLEMNWGMATVFVHQKITGAPADDSEDSVDESELEDT